MPAVLDLRREIGELQTLEMNWRVLAEKARLAKLAALEVEAELRRRTLAVVREHGPQLRRLREESGLCQAAVGDAGRLSQAQVSHIERGHTNAAALPSLVRVLCAYGHIITNGNGHSK